MEFRFDLFPDGFLFLFFKLSVGDLLFPSSTSAFPDSVLRLSDSVSIAVWFTESSRPSPEELVFVFIINSFPDFLMFFLNFLFFLKLSFSPFFRRLVDFLLACLTVEYSFETTSFVLCSFESVTNDVGNNVETVVSGELVSCVELFATTIGRSSALVVDVTTLSEGFSIFT